MMKKWVLAFVSVIATILLLTPATHASNEIIVSLENPPADNVYVVDDAPIDIGMTVNLSENIYNGPVQKGTLLCINEYDPYWMNVTLNKEDLLGIACYASRDNGSGDLTFITNANESQDPQIYKGDLLGILSSNQQYGGNSQFLKFLAEHISPFSDSHGTLTIPPHAPDGEYTADCAIFYNVKISYGSNYERTCAVMALDDSLAKFTIDSSEPDDQKPTFDTITVSPENVEQGSSFQITIEGKDDYFGIDIIKGRFDAIIAGGYSGDYDFAKTIPFVMSEKDGNCTTQGEYPEKTWTCTKSINIPSNAYPGEFELAAKHGDIQLHDKFWNYEGSCHKVYYNTEACSNLPKFKVFPFYPLTKKLLRKKILLKHWFQYPFRKF